MDIMALIKRCFYLIVIFPCLCVAQFVEDFSDGEHAVDPPWEGDIAAFRVNDDLQLQLDEVTAGSACLFSEIYSSDEMEWRCWVKQAFSPSANNYSRVYLLADQAHTEILPDGIFLLLGEAGSADALRLMEQKNGDT